MSEELLILISRLQREALAVVTARIQARNGGELWR